MKSPSLDAKKTACYLLTKYLEQRCPTVVELNCFWHVERNLDLFHEKCQEIKNGKPSDRIAFIVTNMSAEDRKAYHFDALSFGLKSKTVTQNDCLYLVISPKCSLADLMKDLKDHGDTCCFTLREIKTHYLS